MWNLPWKQGVFELLVSPGPRRLEVSVAPVAGPSPSEAGIYGGLTSSASGIFVADEDSRRLAFLYPRHPAEI